MPMMSWKTYDLLRAKLLPRLSGSRYKTERGRQSRLKVLDEIDRLLANEYQLDGSGKQMTWSDIADEFSRSLEASFYDPKIDEDDVWAMVETIERYTPKLSKRAEMLILELQLNANELGCAALKFDDAVYMDALHEKAKAARREKNRAEIDHLLGYDDDDDQDGVAERRPVLRIVGGKEA